LPTAILENVDSFIEKVELSFFKHSRWQSIVADRSVVASKNIIIKLADKGIEVNSGNSSTLVKYIAHAIASNLDMIPHKPAKSVLGWAGNDFMPYTDKIVFDGDDQFRHLYKAVAQKGSVDDWIEHMKLLRKNLYTCFLKKMSREQLNLILYHLTIQERQYIKEIC